MRTEVYNWRVSRDLKVDLERAAREARTSVSSVLDEAAREWLKKRGSDAAEDELQMQIHRAAAKYFGAFAGENPNRAESASRTVREKLKRRYGR
jgi:hypothetical protein